MSGVTPALAQVTAQTVGEIGMPVGIIAVVLGGGGLLLGLVMASLRRRKVVSKPADEPVHS